MGQQDVIELQKQHYLMKHQKSLNAFESKVFKKPDHASRHMSRQINAIPRSSLKADQAADQQMDSILWELYDTENTMWVLSEREIFSYDGDGNMITYVWFEYDSLDMKILPVDKENVKYDLPGKPIEIIWLTWDKASSQWVNEAKFELAYDGDGNLVEETVYDWDPVGSQWLEGARYTMLYDANGNILEEYWYFWDEDSSKLVLVFKDEYLYEGGKLTTWNEYYMQEGGLELTFVTTYTYSGDNLISEITQGWDYITEDWGDYSKKEYIYNEADQLISEEVWDFDWVQLMMVRQWLYEYTWDADGNMTVQVDKGWNEGAPVKSLNDVAEWENTFKSEWTFDKNFTIMDIYAPYWFTADVEELTFVHMPLSELGYFYDNEDWVFDFRQTAYYSEFGGGGPSGIKDMQRAPVSVFPNPASETVTFSWDEGYARLDLEIYDLTGKQIISRTIEQNETIRVDDLSGGLYLYKLSNNNHLIDAGKISLR
jgi:hypothetical protein